MNENYNKNIYSVSDISNIDLARDNEFKLFIDFALLKYFKGNWTKAAMLSCYAHMFKKHKLNPFICEDSFFAQLYEKNINSIEKTKKELKDEGFITTERKGLDPRKYISVNMEKVFEIYKNFGEQKSSEFLAGAQPPKITGREPTKITGGIYNNDNIIKKYNNINAREGDFSRVEDNNNPIQNLENNIPASGSPSSPNVDELSANVSSIKPKKVKKLKDYEKDEVFLSIWKTLPEYMRGCGPVKAYKAYLNATEKGTKNVEEIKKAILFYLKTLPEWQHPQHLSTFLNQGTWEEFYARAVEQEQKKEKARALREKQQKEEAEQRKRVLKERAQVFEAKYQVLKNKLNEGYDTLEEISQENEELFYDVVQQIRDYERKLEEKEAEKKKQQELEQKKIDAENSKHNLDECERELWTYISQVIDVNAYLDRNKKKLPNSYEKFKALFSNGETLLDVVFGELAKDTVVERLKNNILSFLINEMSNEEARKLYNKRNDAWTKWNQLTKAIA